MVGTFDLTMKKLFESEPEKLIKFFTNVNLERPKPLNVEFQALESRIPDLIFEGFLDGERVIVHLELQCDNDPDMHCRMLRYAAEIFAKYRCDILQEVIYAGAGALRMPSEICFSFNERAKLHYRYMVLDLGSLSGEALQRTGIASLYSFLPLTDRRRRGANPEEFLRHSADTIITSPLSKAQKQDLLLSQEMLAGLPFDKRLIEKVFKEVEKMLDLTQSAGYQRILEKGKEIGLEAGKDHWFEKGKEIGEEIGKEIASRNVLWELLQCNYKPVDPELKKRLEQIRDPDVLQNLIVMAGTGKPLDEIRRVMAEKTS